MGLKKTNYESKKLGLTLPMAYAVVKTLKIKGEDGYATINVQTSRERALTMTPIEEYNVSFRVNRSEILLRQLTTRLRGSTIPQTVYKSSPLQDSQMQKEITMLRWT